MTRVNLRTVAAAAGVNVATASRALRGLGIVAPETRRRVEQAAAQLGYTRDPGVSRTLAYIRRAEKPVYRETLAFLAERPIPAKPQMVASWLYELYHAAAARAARLGCGLEVHRLERSQVSQRRLGRTLRARGIRGVIVAPVTWWQPAMLHLEMDSMAVVQISNTIWKPAIHRVEGDFFNDVTRAFSRLKQRGYRRLGLAIERRYERIRRWSPLAAMLLFQQFSGGLPQLVPMEKRHSWTLEGFRAWLAAEQPDVVITNGRNVPDWLGELGLQTPRDIGLMRLDADPAGGHSGLIPDYAGFSAAAVDMVTSMVETADFGEPRTPRNLQLGHLWHEGETLRPARAM